jgi:hypothetical protein
MKVHPMTLKALPARSVFASVNLLEHLARGAVGIAALGAAIAIAAEQPWPSLMLGGVALLAFRGCPVCWTVGLVETIVRRQRGRLPASA